MRFGFNLIRTSQAIPWAPGPLQQESGLSHSSSDVDEIGHCVHLQSKPSCCRQQRVVFCFLLPTVFVWQCCNHQIHVTPHAPQSFLFVSRMVRSDLIAERGSASTWSTANDCVYEKPIAPALVDEYKSLLSESTPLHQISREREDDHSSSSSRSHTAGGFSIKPRYNDDPLLVMTHF